MGEERQRDSVWKSLWMESAQKYVRGKGASEKVNQQGRRKVMNESVKKCRFLSESLFVQSG